MKFLSTTTFAFLLFLGVNAAPVQADTIVDIAVSDPDTFSSLVDAVVAQDLAETLSGEGSFTVFAPTNDAFAALPGYVGNALEAEPELLTDILLHHVVGEELFAADVLEKNRIKTLQGDRVRVSANDEGAFINQSELIATDVDASNGVVHVIDRVLIPNTVYQAAINNIRAEIVLLQEVIRDVRGDRQNDRRGH